MVCLDFTEEQINRYSRQIVLPEVGGTGQKRINEGRVLIIGTGGLGSPAAFYLAAAGVGTIGIIDYDVVDLSNLQRQILHTTKDIGRPKVDSAKEKLIALNPDCNIVSYRERLTARNIKEIIKDYDVVVDGADNFATRFVANDACVMANKVFVHGGVLGFAGQTFTIVPGKGPCLRCILREPPPYGSVPTCAQAGVLGVLAGTIGLIQATEVLKYLLGKGDLLVGRLLAYDALEMKFREVRVKKDPACPVCGDNPSITELVEYDLTACAEYKNGGAVKMCVFTVNGLEVEIDEDGFIIDPGCWNEDVARAFAEAEGIKELNDEHWRVINYLRDHYQQFQVAPMISKLCKETGFSLKHIYELFPSGPAKGACKVAGLPKPRGCV